MAEIINFTPKSQLDAQANMLQFINECKHQLTVFGADLNWDSWLWYKAGHFTKLGTHSRSPNDADKLHDDFIDFAKAYFRYQQGHNPTGTKNELKALRAIEAALLQQTQRASPLDLTITILDHAAQLIREHYTAGAAYQGGRELERLAKFVTQKHLVATNLSHWRNPIIRKQDDIQTGAKAKARREKKMPSEAALNALAEIFANNPSDPRDIFTSATFALLMCAPSRITEVLELPVDCEVEQTDSKGKIRYGWRFYSGKGFGANIKWIPTEMVSIAKEAIARIKHLTEEARSIAKWLEENPNLFYRHAECPTVADNYSLSTEEACKALGVQHLQFGNYKLAKQQPSYTLNNLWQYVLSRQPKSFPYVNQEIGLTYSNALFCMQANLLGSQRGTSPVILWFPSNNIFNNDLSPREALTSHHESIFDRHGYKTEAGERVKLTSHQARHLLNTIAQRGGLSQLEIAKWSGRAETKQNRVYNHMSEYEMVAMAEQLDTSLTLFGPSGDLAQQVPITIQEFNCLEKGAVHITEFGVCVHDFTMSPCDKYRDCLNCTEQVCIKGDDAKLERIKQRLEQVDQQYQAAQQAIQQGLAGADRWYEYHRDTLSRLSELVQLLENPSIPDKAQIKLRNDKAFSPLRRAVEAKLTSELPKVQEELQLLNDMTQLLGGGLG